jgi:hypothetical protein
MQYNYLTFSGAPLSNSFYHLHREEHPRPPGLPGYLLVVGFIVGTHQSGGEAIEATWPPSLPPTLHRLHVAAIQGLHTLHRLHHSCTCSSLPRSTICAANRRTTAEVIVCSRRATIIVPTRVAIARPSHHIATRPPRLPTWPLALHLSRHLHQPATTEHDRRIDHR